MRPDFLAILVVTAVVLFPNVIHAEYSCGSNQSSIDLKYTIQGDNVKSVCQDIEARSIIVTINSTDNGKLNIEMVRDLYDPRNADCTDSSYFVLVDREEVSYDEKTSSYSRIFTVPFELGNSRIEFIGFSGVMSQRDGKTCPPLVDNILPPRQQIANGSLPENVICNEGLQLIFKSKDNSPACVKPQTRQKLIERGWTHS